MTLEEQANILNQIKEAAPDNPFIASLCVQLSEDYPTYVSFC